MPDRRSLVSSRLDGGLGLAIVREVAQRHGAGILLLDGLPGSHRRSGLTVRLRFATQNTTRMANNFIG